MTTYIKQALFACLSFFFLLAGCDGSESCSGKTNKLLIFLDQTDKNVFHSVKDDVGSAISKNSKRMFPCRPCEGGYLRIVRVIDNCQNRPLLENSYLPLPEGITSADILPKDYTKFLHSIKNYSAEIALDSTVSGFKNTCLYEPICKELNSLVNKFDGSSGGHTKVIIYSDMLEHTEDAATDLYKQDTLASADFEERLKKRFKIELPDLSGVEVHIITATNTKTQDKVRYAGTLWKEMFENHGAKVDGPKPNF
jgi:hypothetical protein